jgi:hypothetical protein
MRIAFGAQPRVVPHQAAGYDDRQMTGSGARVTGYR